MYARRPSGQMVHTLHKRTGYALPGIAVRQFPRALALESRGGESPVGIRKVCVNVSPMSLLKGLVQLEFPFPLQPQNCQLPA